MAPLRKLIANKSMSGLYIGALMFLGVVLAGTVAYVLKGWKLSDAFYMVVITVFSVGYEEVEPVNTDLLRTITMIIIIAGDASKVYFVGSLIRFITEGEIGRAMEEHRKSRDIESIRDHAIICGYGRIGQTLARELTQAGFPFVIVDNNEERVSLARAHGFQSLQGDGGDEKTLSEARIDRAKVLATVLPSDMVNVFITLTARNMRPDLRIIARAEDPSTEKKLKQAGASEIILPAFVGGVQIANSITKPSIGELLRGSGRYMKHDLQEIGLDIVEHVIKRDSTEVNQTILQLLKGIESRCLVLCVKTPEGTMLQYPPANHVLEADSVVMMLAHGPAF